MLPALSSHADLPCSKWRGSSQPRDNTVTVPHFPNEIWAEIHTHIPPETVIKLIGVNRYFFDAAMNEIYKVISVTNSDDVEQNRRLQELQNPHIASRVRHIQLSPLFLPFCDYDGKPSSQQVLYEDQTFLKKTMTVLYNCKNLEHLTIQIHFTRAVTRSFQDFLKTLVSRAGLQLRELTIGICVFHFRILAAIASLRSLSPSIDTVTLTILPSNFINQSRQVRYRPPSNEVLESFTGYMLDFSTSVKHSLQDLYITNYESVDISQLFKSPEGFFSLKTFQYQGRRHAPSILPLLQSFEQILRTPTSLHFLSFRLATSSVPMIPSLLVDDPTFHSPLAAHYLFVFELRALHNLRIQVPQYPFTLGLDELTSILATFCPDLNRLAIESPVPLTNDWFHQLLDVVVKFSRNQERGSRLSYLSFRRLGLFTAIHLDEILRNLPHLEVLAIEFKHLSIDPASRRGNPAESRAEFHENVFTTFRTRRYSSSRLKELYLKGPYGLPARLIESLTVALPNVRLLQGPFP